MIPLEYGVWFTVNHSPLLVPPLEYGVRFTVLCWPPQDPLEFQSRELRKYFVVGDHVRVVAGRHEGETGLIVRVEINLAVLLSDLALHEVSEKQGGEGFATDLSVCLFLFS